VLTNANSSIGFDTEVIESADELDVLNAFPDRSVGWGMFLTNHFAFPLAIDTVVRTGVEDERVTAIYLAVLQYQDATDFNVLTIEGKGDQ
jgi:hypothetical protein